jgi:hypothetical protein
MKLRAMAIAFCCAFGMAADGWAQVAWDSPLLLPPNPEAGTGLYLIDAHRAGVGALGTWRGPGQGTGFRLGIADGRGDGIAIFGGIDMVAPLATASAAFPLDISWLIGAGAGYDRWLTVSVPLGLTLGRTIHGDGVRFTPYFSPRLNLDAQFARDPPRDRNSLDLGLAVDIGIDVAFQPTWTLRIGGSLGDRSGVAVGIQF